MTEEGRKKFQAALDKAQKVFDETDNPIMVLQMLTETMIGLSAEFGIPQELMQQAFDEGHARGTELAEEALGLTPTPKTEYKQ